MHHREWNPKSFFRHLTPPALDELQAWASVTLQLDGKDSPGLQFYRAWKALDVDERTRIETELLVVNDMCSRHARPYLEQQVAPFVWTDEQGPLIEESREWSAQDVALRLFVADPARFREAHRAYAVDALEHFREYPGSYEVTLATTPEAKARMKGEMITHFRDTAFGARCQIEDFANDEKFAIFVFHEDEMAPFDRFNDSGVMEPDWQRPVVRLAAVFHYETSTLLVKAPRKVEREKLRDLFAEVFVRDPNYFGDVSKTPKFNFDVLRDPDFDFPTHGVDAIDEVSVVKVIARTAHHDAKRVTIELRPGLSIVGLGMVLEEHGISLESDPLDGVQLRFTFEGKGRSKYRTVSLFNPNSTNLNDTRRDRVIRRCLKEWGIDVGSRAAMDAAADRTAAE